MLSVRSLVKRLDVFERNKIPLDLKVLGLAFYIQLSSLRRPPGPCLRSIGPPRRLSGGG
jgi:hypothetical protein